MLTQSEINTLFEMLKIVDKKHMSQTYPQWKEKREFSLFSEDKKEEFRLVIDRNKGVPTKITSVKLARNGCCLRRLDIDTIHQNPTCENIPSLIPEEYNGKKISSPHIHLYIENFGDKWALPLDYFIKENPLDNYGVVKSFLKYCNIINMPELRNINKLF